jgi:hypothetical protein
LIVRVTKLHRLPIVWLSAAILIAIIAGCIITIVLGQRYADEPMPAAGETLLNMPLGNGRSPRE